MNYQNRSFERLTDVSEILDRLNDRQREAVVAEPGPLLVTAGAGSGKTSVLVRRIAWLIKAFGVSKHQIMAVTFTNKAAREMKSRVEDLLGMNEAPYRIGTFHGLSNSFLRIYHEAAGLESDFTILDSGDQKSLISRLNRDLRISVGEFKPQQFQNFINRSKSNELRATALSPRNYREQIFVRVYEAYENYCEANSLVDFEELLLRTVELLKRNQLVREELQDRYQHVLVDEFQDTNSMQLEWLKLFCGKRNQITAVGDEDQSIYGWRGALAENMIQFEAIFPGTRIVRLEQNYRSTQTILNAANAVIQHNDQRYSKELWTERKKGASVKLFNAYDSGQEAKFVAEVILSGVSRSIPYSNFAVLYRTNAQSREFEEVFGYQQIPFRIYGGLRFYQRKEIKDILAYLRLLVEPNNNEAFSRVVNFPRRGIGSVAQERIAQYASSRNLSYWQASSEIVKDYSVQVHFRAALTNFLELINRIREEGEHESFGDVIASTISISGVKQFYKSRKLESDITRIENLDELENAAVNFIRRSNCKDSIESIRPFLDTVALDSDDKHDENTLNAVQVMTLHLAKGLEFPVVFLVGVDENLLPHVLSLKSDQNGRRGADKDSLAEERRLFYVGMTRAEQQLFLTRSGIRMVRGRMSVFRPSRFLKEIPRQFLDTVPFNQKIDSDFTKKINPDDLLGSTIDHRVFGRGCVTGLRHEGKFPVLTIDFDEHGTKQVLWEMNNFKVRR